MAYAYQLQTSRHDSYEVQLMNGLLAPGQALLANMLRSRCALLVTTPTVAKLYAQVLQKQLQDQGLNIPMLILDCKEQTKTLDQVERVCKEAQKHRLDRAGVLVGFGGGVCTDIITVAASWIRRGINHLRIPTTLIGQVDASIGIKGAVNFQEKKNYLGCFYPPEAVLIDPVFLQTLQSQHLCSGLSEIIKIALVHDQILFELIEQHTNLLVKSGFSEPQHESREILWRSVVGMLEELKPNIYEDQTAKRLVDFGHTFSPSLEAASAFSISHGEAVAIDMALTCVIASELGYLDGEKRDRIISVLGAASLPIYSQLLTDQLCMNALEEISLHRAGAINLVTPTEIGRAVFLERLEDLSPSVVKSAISWLAKRSRPASKSRQHATACLVFDVGGTNVRSAIYHPTSNSLSHLISRSTANHWTMPDATADDIRQRLLRDMRALSREVLKDEQPAFVSVAFPGPLDKQGRVLAAPTVWGSLQDKPIEFISDLEHVWPEARISLINDVSAAGYRYLQHEDEDLCIVTVSSGIGNKVFIKGRPITGPAGHGGEIGHVLVDFSQDAPLCDCGERGHLGAIASGRGALLMARLWAKRDPAAFASSMLAPRFGNCLDTLDNKDIVEAFHAGDDWILNLIRHAARPLGQMLAAIHLGTGNEKFVVVGGFALALGESYRLELVKAASRCGWQVGQDWNAMIELGQPDDHSGLLGAGRFAMRYAGRH